MFLWKNHFWILFIGSC